MTRLSELAMITFCFEYCIIPCRSGWPDLLLICIVVSNCLLFLLLNIVIMIRLGATKSIGSVAFVGFFVVSKRYRVTHQVDNLLLLTQI